MKKIIILSVVCIFSIYSIYYFFGNKNTYNIFTIRQEIIDEIVKRFDNNSLTKYDKKTMGKIYGNMVFFGGIIYPEAAKILKHYISGNGEDIKIISKYFFESRIIKDALTNNPKIEIIGPITLKINEDPRIAYAINGFYIKNSDPIEIYQKINFANRDDRHTYTLFSIFNKEIKIPDRLIRMFEMDGGCKEFTVKIREK
jgi:hypothetical protein